MQLVYKRTGLILWLSSVLVGCSDSNMSNENLGRLGGGVAGAVIGNQVSDSTAAPVIGAVVGSYVGSEMGRNKDKHNQEVQAQSTAVLNSTLTKTSTTWTDPTGQTTYIMSVSEPFQNQEMTCRPYTLKTIKLGSETITNGVACLVDGQWRIVS